MTAMTDPDGAAVPEPLGSYLLEMEAALEARLEYPALALALALPDVCVTLESTTCDTNKDLYAGWCDRWVTCATFYGAEQQLRALLDAIHYGSVSGESCVELNGVLQHLGRAVALVSVVERREVARYEARGLTTA